MLAFLFIIFTYTACSKHYLLQTEDIKIWVETADLGEKWNTTDAKEETANAVDAGANMNTTDVKVIGNDRGVELINDAEVKWKDAGVTSKEGDAGVKWKKPGSRGNRDSDMSSGLAGYKSYMKRYRRY